MFWHGKSVLKWLPSHKEARIIKKEFEKKKIYVVIQQGEENPQKFFDVFI